MSAQIHSEQALRNWLESEDPPSRRQLLELLSESHALYREAGAAEVVRMRGALLLALARHEMPDEALPYLLEELENAHDPYLTAVAAHSLRSFRSADAAFVQPLLSALLYIRHRDAPVRLSSYGGYDGHASRGERTSAMAEVLHTLAWLESAGRSALPRLSALLEEEAGSERIADFEEVIARIESAPDPAADSCCGARLADAEPEPHRSQSHWAAPGDITSNITSIELQDQQGLRLRFDEFFLGKPSIVVFFYTRCENPAKCPRTISRLGELQRRLHQEGLGEKIRTAAITYDPEFDLPVRLEQFRRSWGAEAGPDHRLLRTTSDFAALRSYFELGVNYTSAVVNRHRLETYLLDRSGCIRHMVTRTHWDHDDLIERASGLLRI